jgi:HSP20 family protein
MLTRFFDLNDTFSLMDAFERQMAHAFYDGTRSTSKSPTPFADTALRDEGDKLTITASLPGVAKSSIDVSIEGDILTLKAERKLEAPKDYRLVRRERGNLQFARQIELGVPVEANAVEAAFVDGVLTVTLPKSPTAKPRKIPIGRIEEGKPTAGSA